MISETVGAAKASAWHVDEAAVGVKRQRSMRRAGNECCGQGVAVDVEIIGQDARGGCDSQRLPLRGRIRFGIRARRVIDRRDIDHHHRIGGNAASIIDGMIGEAVGAVIIGARRIEKAATGVQDQRSVRGARNKGGSQRIGI